MKTTEILFVEDNPDDIRLTLRALKKRNLSNKILTITDGEEALEYIFCKGRYVERHKSQKPKVIVLDLKLPKVGGIEILKMIKSDEHTKNIPVIILTSSREESDMIKSYSYGVNSYVVKPINFDSFTEAISSLGIYWLLVNESL
jgi:two-component system, response regulator